MRNIILNHPKYGVIIALMLAGIAAMGVGYFLTDQIMRVTLATPLPSPTPIIITSGTRVTRTPNIVPTLPASPVTESAGAASGNKTFPTLAMTPPSPSGTPLPGGVHPTFVPGQECGSCHNKLRGGKP